MVSFTNTPVFRSGNILARKINATIMSIENINELWDTDEVMQKWQIVKNTQKIT